MTDFDSSLWEYFELAVWSLLTNFWFNSLIHSFVHQLFFLFCVWDQRSTTICENCFRCRSKCSAWWASDWQVDCFSCRFLLFFLDTFNDVHFAICLAFYLLFKKAYCLGGPLLREDLTFLKFFICFRWASCFRLWSRILFDALRFHILLIINFIEFDVTYIKIETWKLRDLGYWVDQFSFLLSFIWALKLLNSDLLGGHSNCPGVLSSGGSSQTLFFTFTITGAGMKALPSKLSPVVSIIFLPPQLSSFTFSFSTFPNPSFFFNYS